jgi:hypothetical protein
MAAAPNRANSGRSPPGRIRTISCVRYARRSAVRCRRWYHVAEVDGYADPIPVHRRDGREVICPPPPAVVADDQPMSPDMEPQVRWRLPRRAWPTLTGDRSAMAAMR